MAPPHSGVVSRQRGSSASTGKYGSGSSNQPDTHYTDHRGDSGLNDMQKQEGTRRQCDTQPTNKQ
jgi:hypothetical protein